MKKLFSKLFSKVVLTAILIALQIAWIVYVIYQATLLSQIMNWILIILAVILALHVVNKDLKPYYKLSWCFLILCLPVLGSTCYFLFGRSELTKKKVQQLAESGKRMRPFRKQDERVLEEAEKEELLFRKEAAYIRDFAGFPVYRNQGSRYYPSGEAAFPSMLEDLKSAKNYIFLEYFIVAPGKMFDTMLEILEEKVKEGVEVRMIYDDVGSINNVSPRFDKIMEARGIRCVRFNPFRPIMAVIMNNRDHRKILSVDGRVAYTGGINLADEYINEIVKYGYWKDEAIRVEGRAAWSFTTMFLEMWNYVKKSQEDYGRYDLFPGENKEEAGFVLPFSDAPLDQEDVSENVYLNIVNHAKDYIYIFTPYLILSWEMNRALINAAKTGVDVRIVTPGIPDKKLVYLLTQANSESLIRGGVKIYTYKPGFIHSKCIVSDDKYAVVGTINLDFRSLYLHFECGILLYRTKSVQQVYEDALATMANSHLVALDEYDDKSFFHEMLLSILQLFAPLL